MYTEEPSISMYTKAFVAEARRDATKTQRHLSQLVVLETKRDQIRHEREKLLRMRKAANRAVRAANEAMREANEAVRMMRAESSASRRMLVGAPRTMASVVALVSRYTGVSTRDILGTSQTRRIVLARQAALYGCVLRTDKTFEQIARFFNRERTTIVHGVSTYIEKRAVMGRKLRKVR